MNSIIKGAAYTLIHAPDMVVHNGTTQTTERIVNPNSDYLKALPKHLRSFDDAAIYPPNQVYIGNQHPEFLNTIGDLPWYNKLIKGASRFSKNGEIMPEEEFYLLMHAVDAFNLVMLDADFIKKYKPIFDKHPVVTAELKAKIGAGFILNDIEAEIKNNHAEGLYFNHKLIGCVKRAHDIDENLSAHVILENLVSKASSVTALLNLIKHTGISPDEVDMVLDCSEEAVGDMNQRGGGNLAKACAESCGFVNASGSDIRAFCAAPTHAIIHAAALVASGTYDNVIVAAGGSTAKLGMNGKDHVKKEMPVLEDVVGSFAVLISKNDGVSPEILSPYTGKHTVGSGSSPQAVTKALVADPLEKMGIRIVDIDKFSAEMHNPDVTKPAGAGDVPLANFKMIGALAVMRGEFDRTQIDAFTAKHGNPGWAPTQGHIPSGVPFLEFARQDILAGKIKNSMIIGKGSLFLGRMTNLFDGVSFIIQKNAGISAQNTASDIKKPKIILTGLGSEHGEQNMIEGALQASKANAADITYIGSNGDHSKAVSIVETNCEKIMHEKMDAMLNSKQADGAVTMHYSFPIGVSTIGRVITPAYGKAMYIASTTGTSSTNRAEAMVKNALNGIIVAKASGVKTPKVGILNVDGARSCEKALKDLKAAGYDIEFAGSNRSDGGCIMRGNDAMTAACDVLVCDSLTGNVLMKMFSAFTTGGNYESIGFGYGPGMASDYEKLVLILSRASGAPVVANSILFAAELVNGNYKKVLKDEYKKAEKAGLEKVLEAVVKASGAKKSTAKKAGAKEIKAPKQEVVDTDINGVEVENLDAAVEAVWAAGIYASSGMGCTGIVIQVAKANEKKARDVLIKKGFLVKE
ncbi:MAG: glycine/sarcosine/betaine reductase complex component C subunit beta [Firmicutes bacterium]|nr:glycine/sarcosine/betaine reductase complex component C subunit beta [Bacillota bacterium]